LHPRPRLSTKGARERCAPSFGPPSDPVHAQTGHADAGQAPPPFAPAPSPFARALRLVHARTGYANAGPHGTRHTPFAPAPPFMRERTRGRRGTAGQAPPRPPLLPPPLSAPVYARTGHANGGAHRKGHPPFAHKGAGGKVRPSLFCPPFHPRSSNRTRKRVRAGQSPRGDTQTGEREVAPPPLCTKGQANRGLHANPEAVPSSGLRADPEAPPPFAPSDPACAQRGTNRDRGNGKGCLHPFPPPACLRAEGERRCEGAETGGCTFTLPIVGRGTWTKIVFVVYVTYSY